MQKFLSNSPEETEKIGENLGNQINEGCVIAYRGGLGMGKTCFTRGLAKGLGSNDTVTSPTFALINEYPSGRIPLYHFDMFLHIVQLLAVFLLVKHLLLCQKPYD